MPAFDVQSFLSLLAQGLLVIALPIVIAAGIQALRVQASRLGQERLETILAAVRMAVGLAERAGLTEGLTGAEKRAAALKAADTFLRKRGIQLDLEELADLIEAEVILQFNNPQPIADTTEARDALIERAIQAAVLAAEQAGLAGFIENIGATKKAHAMNVAAQYFSEMNVAVSPDLTSQLIEAQVLRYRLSVNGRLQADVARVARRSLR